MRISDTLTGWLLLLFGSAVAAYAWTFPPAAGQSIGPGGFPLLIGGGLAVAGALLVRAGLKQHDRRSLHEREDLRQPRLALRGALVIGALLFYALVVETVGFFITAFFFLGGLFLVFGVRLRWIPLLAASVTLGIHLAFYSLLHVPLPWGWLEDLAW